MTLKMSMGTEGIKRVCMAQERSRRGETRQVQMAARRGVTEGNQEGCFGEIEEAKGGAG
jgi:hypothetical protein